MAGTGPGGVTGCTHWFVADDISGVADGGPVTSWPSRLAGERPLSANLVLDGHFENDTAGSIPTAWTTQYQTEGTPVDPQVVTSATDGAGHVTGGQSLRMQFNGLGNGNSVASVSIPVTPGQTIAVGGRYIGTDTHTGGVWIRVAFGNAAGFLHAAKVSETDLNLQSVTTSWQAIGPTEVTVPAGVSFMRVVLYCWNQAGSGYVYWDSIYAVPVDGSSSAVPHGGPLLEAGTVAAPLVLFGVNAGPGSTNASGPRTAEATRLTDFGRVPCSRIYYSGQLPSAVNSAITAASPENRCQPSFKGWNPDQVAAGAADSVITSFAADAMAKALRIFLTYWHEPNKELNTGQYTAADYKAAHIHVAQLLWSLPSKDVVTPMLNYSAPNNSGGNAWNDSWLPSFSSLGNPNAILSWDTYGNPSGGTGLDGAYPTPDKVFSQMYTKTQLGGYDVDGRWGVTEFNTPRRNFDTDESQRGPWIQSAVDYVLGLPTRPHHMFLWEGDGVQFDQNFYTANTRSVWKSITAGSA